MTNITHNLILTPILRLQIAQGATGEGCRALAIAESTFEYLWFDGSLEEWMDGKPFETRKVD